MDSASQPLRRRFTRTGCAGLYILMFPPTVALFAITVPAIPLVVVTVGVVFLLVTVPFTRLLADAHRRLAADILGTPVPTPYRSPSRRGPLGRVRDWATDPARWRDLLWLLVSMTAGFVLSVIALAFFLGILWYAFFPVLWAITPDGVFDVDWGIFVVDTQGEAIVWAGTLLVIALLLWWYVSPALITARAHIDRALLGPTREQLEERVQHLTESRADTVDFSAAELRRIERDLHDGAQARLVSLGMSLGMADEMLTNNPDEARRLLAEARSATTAALSDMRSIVRGIHPPVLAERGLSGAVQALTMDMPLPVTLSVELPGRPPAPVESAAYFGVAECLTNIVRHSDATQAWIALTYEDDTLRMVVSDNGTGGARFDAGSGLVGVRRRLDAFDGKMVLSSPDGGPTTIWMELPCVLSSPKTSPSSGTD